MGFQYFMGIDVQTRRKCPYSVLNRENICVLSGWLEGNSKKELFENLTEIIDDLEKNVTKSIAIGIDAPRAPLTVPRQHFWNRNRNSWRNRNEGERGYGRHCEVILKSLNIANPQWTPTEDNCPTWMQLGFALFSCFKDREGVFEVFPTASYSIFKGRTNPKVTIDFANFSTGPKDMIDAFVSAITVLEYSEGRGCAVGGGDGLGSIILPGPLPVDNSHPILRWPN
jgi:predicted nuclease with RNAse H fold